MTSSLPSPKFKIDKLSAYQILNQLVGILNRPRMWVQSAESLEDVCFLLLQIVYGDDVRKTYEEFVVKNYILSWSIAPNLSQTDKDERIREMAEILLNCFEQYLDYV